MPIIIDERTAYGGLQRILSKQQAMHQDIRELHILIANLMPSAVRVQTESSLAHLLGDSSLQVKLSYYRPHPLKNDSTDNYFRQANEIDATKYDALIVTGANVDNIPFKDVEFKDDLHLLTTQNFPVKIGLCWGGMALLHTLYGLEKENYKQKAFGIYDHHKTIFGEQSELLAGTNDILHVPVSRWAGFKTAPQLRVLAESEQTGPYIITSETEDVIVVANHPEYDTMALHNEAVRDGTMPHHYYPQNNVAYNPKNIWRADATILWRNMIRHIYEHSVGKTKV
jgi:homoserine O-succinyltransferase/O-acetyltransferase